MYPHAVPLFLFSLQRHRPGFIWQYIPPPNGRNYPRPKSLKLTSIHACPGRKRSIDMIFVVFLESVLGEKPAFIKPHFDGVLFGATGDIIGITPIFETRQGRVWKSIRFYTQFIEKSWVFLFVCPSQSILIVSSFGCCLKKPVSLKCTSPDLCYEMIGNWKGFCIP